MIADVPLLPHISVPCESKNPPYGFSEIFPQTVGNF